VLKENDLVKIDLGVHIDGYAAVVAHSVAVGKEPTVKGRAADVMAAAYTALECSVRLLKTGAKNSAITEMIAKVAADFKCNPVLGVLSHQMQRFEIDAKKVIINRSDVENKVEEFEMEANEVYALDIVMSSGEGKTKESEDRPTLYKRIEEGKKDLKTKAGRALYHDIRKRFPAFPFSTRDMDGATTRMGMKECLEHDVVVAYPVMLEKEGEFVAQLKATCLLLPGGTITVTGLANDSWRASVQSECKLSEEVHKLMATARGKSAAGKSGAAAKKKKQAKKKKAAAGEKKAKDGDKKSEPKKAAVAAKKEDSKDKPADKDKKDTSATATATVATPKKEEGKKTESSKKSSKQAESSKKDAPADKEKSAAADNKPAGGKKASKQQESGKKAAEPKKA
jgi:curved DNA binding protein